MNIHHLSIYRVPGIIGLPGAGDVELVPVSPKNQARAFLTINRTPYYLHLRRIAATGRNILNKLAGREEHGLSPEQQFAEVLSGIQIQEGAHADSPLLIAEAISAVEETAVAQANRLCDIGFGLNLFDDAKLVESAKHAIEAAIAGLSLALPGGEFREIELLGSVSYAVESPENRMIYSLGRNFIRASGSSSTSVNAETLEAAAKYATELRNDARLATVVRLLSQSAIAADSLTAFLTAWAGLEVFANKTFKDAYEPLAFATIEDASPPARKPFIARLRGVMKDKYNIRDKFVVVSSELDAAGADGDIELFKEIKEERDAVHDMSAAPDTLPTGGTRNLLRKYLRLHLARKAKS